MASLTPAEQQELDAIMARANTRKAQAENPNTPSPLQEHMDQVDPQGSTDQPQRLEMPRSEPDSKPGFLERLRASMGGAKPALTPEQQAQKAALPQVPVGAQDRVFLDSLSRGFADKATALVSGSTVEEQRAKTEQARIDAGDSAGSFKFAGEIAPYMFMGAGAGGLIGAALKGGAMSLADKTANTLGHEDRLPDSEEMVVSGIFGMGGGALGNIVGKGLNGVWSSATHGKEALPNFARRAIARQAQVIDDAGRAMDNSGVVISQNYLKRLSASIEKDLTKSGVTPDGTPKAWMALQRIKSGLSTGKDLTIRQVNELRRGVSEIKGKSFEQKYINDISGTMNRFMKSLPAADKTVVKAGNAQQGIDAWNRMNKTFQDKLKLDTMAEKLAIASAKAKTGNTPFDKAMQDEFSKWTTTKAGKKQFENVFTKEEQRMLLPLTTGSLSTQTSNRIDRVFGMGMFGPAVRAIRAVTAHAPAGVDTMAGFGQKFGQLPGGITPSNIGGLPGSAVAGSIINTGNDLMKPPQDQQPTE